MCDAADLLDSRAAVRFEGERQALATMSHPNVARVVDAGMTGTGPTEVGLYTRQPCGSVARARSRGVVTWRRGLAFRPRLGA